MSASHKLDQYLESFRLRLKRLTVLQGAAAIGVVLLVVSLIGAWLSAESGFSPLTVNVFRLLLVLALAAVAVRFIALPLRLIRRNLAQQVEQRAESFDGRITTYLEMKESNNPLRDLLAEDALRLSATQPVERQVEPREFQIAGLVTAITAIILIWLLVAGPGLLGFGLRNLFAGWAVPGMTPPMAIAVTPGDQSVRRGANLRVLAEMEGFDPEEATLHIRSGALDWQELPMQPAGEQFEFNFFLMQEAMDYYVSANGLRTPQYSVNVVDLPVIENLELTYTYPEWTRRDPETRQGNGDITTLPETRIGLSITTSAPLPEGGQLVLNETGQALRVEGSVASTDFEVLAEGEYYLAALVGGEPVRLSDDYFIRIAEDGAPTIEFTRPGRDWNASNIEEVLARVEAKDDFGLEAVTLFYSVNGGDWQSVDLADADSRTELSAEHLFMLEDITAPEVLAPEADLQIGRFGIVTGGPLGPNEDPARGEPRQGEIGEDPVEDPGAGGNALGGATSGLPVEEPAPIRQVPLQPGDLISYYAEARDRASSAQTDMFFINIQPFNRRFEQSQMSGGPGGGGGGQQDEISQRQRQIVVSTWNLIREQQSSQDAGRVEVNSSLLSDLQTTLAEQAQTLAQRSRARQLSQDDQIAEFVRNMERAVQAMHPAAERLASVELNEAIQPAQEALQYLLRAESVFRDITVTQQQGGGGAGGSAGRDLAEMFELEMDMEKNQYETGNRATPQSQQQQAEDIMKQLDELARRQEQLANNLRNQQQLSEAQRYQQEMLRRQAEQLREQMEQLQNQRQQLANNRQQGQQGQQQPGQQGQEGQQGQSGQQSAQGGQGQGGEQQGGDQQGQPQNGQQQGQAGEQIAQSELQRRLQSALRAMDEAAAAMREGASQEELQRAADEAQRQLEGARDQVAADQMASLQESFRNMADQSQQLVREQEGMEQQLQQAMERALAERSSGENPNSRGMPLEEEWALAREKQELAAELKSLQQQMLNSMQRFGAQAPQATRELQRANDELIASELEQAISDAALYIDSGYGLFIAGNEGSVTAGMRRLARTLEEAQQLAEGAGGAGQSDLERARQQAQDLRSRLQEQLAQNGQPGQGQQAQNGQPQPGQGQQGQQQGQEGQQQGGQQQAGNQQGGQQQGGQAGGGARNGGGPWNGGGWWANGPDDQAGPLDLPENFYGNLDQLTQAARDAVGELNLGQQDLAAMYELIRQLEASRGNRNESILASEYNTMLALVEQLEFSLRSEDDRAGRRNNVRTAVQDPVPEAYQDAVAEYYRRLSEQ